MATTTNYGWDTPDDTDLVKDGATAIRTLGSSIDTTTKNLNPQTTTGALAYRSATANVNTALPIGTAGQILAVSGGVPAWINNDQGDITEVQAGTGISVASGTGPIPVVTNTVATAFDAAGDLVYGTGADTFTKLSLGTVGQVLTVNSGATAPQWSTAGGGDLVKISSVTWTSASAQSLTSVFSATYDNYLIVFDNLVGANSNDFAIRLRSGANNDTNSTYYYANLGFTAGGSASNLAANTDDKFLIDGLSQSPHCTGITLTVFNPFESVRTNMIWTLAMGDSGAAFVYRTGGGLFAANTSFDGLGFFLTGGGNLSGDATVYGYKK